jgi:hypothetical protein
MAGRRATRCCAAYRAGRGSRARDAGQGGDRRADRRIGIPGREPRRGRNALARPRRVGGSAGRPFVAGGEMAHLGARMVTRESVPADDSAASLLRRASEALLGDAGRREPNAPPIEELANDLRRGIERGEIGVLLQPQVAIASGADHRRRGAGALAPPELWRDRRRDLVRRSRARRAGGAAQRSCPARALTGAAQWPQARQAAAVDQRDRRRCRARRICRQPARADRRQRVSALAADRRDHRERDHGGSDRSGAAALRACAPRDAGWRSTISARAIRASPI